jgi:ligand-binding sensor protein
MDGCRECDNAAFREATRRRGIYIYTCHAGMTEAVAPIIFNDTIIGFVILAHMLPKETLESSVENAIALSTRYGVATDDAKTAISLNLCLRIMMTLLQKQRILFAEFQFM